MKLKVTQKILNPPDCLYTKIAIIQVSRVLFYHRLHGLNRFLAARYQGHLGAGGNFIAFQSDYWLTAV